MKLFFYKSSNIYYKIKYLIFVSIKKVNTHFFKEHRQLHSQFSYSYI